MSSSHNIDDLFKQHLGKHEVLPNDRVWNHIASQLDNKKEQRALFLWTKKLSVAAAIALLISLSIGITWLYNSNSTPLHNQQALNIEDTHTTELDSSQTNSLAQNQTTVSTNTSVHSTSTSNKGKSQVLLASDHSNTAFPETKRMTMQTLSPLGQTMQTQTVNTSNLASDKKVQSTKYLPLTNFDEWLPTQNPSSNSLLIGAAASPSYSYRTLENQSKGNQSMGIDEKGLKSMTAAIRIGYGKNNSRWHFESGLIFSKAGQVIKSQVTTLNSTFANNNFAVALRSNEMLAANSMGSINIMESVSETPVFLAPSNPDNLIENKEIFSKEDEEVIPQTFLSSTEEPIRINQVLEYLEVPLMARYNVIQKHAIVSLAFGISTNMLINNSAYVTYNNVSSDLGETEAIDKISYSARIGFGIGVPLFKGILFNMEPTINYFLQPVNNQGNAEFKPYTVAVLTGFSYQF